MLSSKTNALLTHTLASFWRKQSCLLLQCHNVPESGHNRTHVACISRVPTHSSSCLVKIKLSWQTFGFYFSYNQSTNKIKHLSSPSNFKWISRVTLYTAGHLHTAVPHCSHSRAPGEQWARLCVFTLQGCVQAARLCRGSPVNIDRPTLLSCWEALPLLD